MRERGLERGEGGEKGIRERGVREGDVANDLQQQWVCEGDRWRGGWGVRDGLEGA